MTLLTPAIARIGIIIAAVLAIVGGFAFQQQSVGVQKERARSEKATTNAVNKARRAGDRSVAGGGVRSPYYRD